MCSSCLRYTYVHIYVRITPLGFGFRFGFGFGFGFGLGLDTQGIEPIMYLSLSCRVHYLVSLSCIYPYHVTTLYTTLYPYHVTLARVADRYEIVMFFICFICCMTCTRGLNLLFASTSAGANRSYYGSSYTSIIGPITDPAIQALNI